MGGRRLGGVIYGRKWGGCCLWEWGAAVTERFSCRQGTGSYCKLGSERGRLSCADCLYMGGGCGWVSSGVGRRGGARGGKRRPVGGLEAAADA